MREHADANSPRLVLARVPRSDVGPLEGVTFVDVNPIRRQDLLRALALAAGRTESDVDAVIELAEQPKRKAPTREEALARGELILLAEDNLTNQDVIRRQLATLGYACDIADDGVLALAAWQSTAYGLLLTDCNMPNMDGFELTAAIRVDEDEHQERARIVAITASVLQDELDRCIDAGMDDTLPKPVALPALKAALEKWLPTADGKEALTIAPNEHVAVPTAGHAAVVDPAFLRESLGDDPALIAEILSDYLTPAMAIMAEIDAAWNEHSAADVVAAAHKLKSASRAIGADALDEICERREGANPNH